MKNQILCNKGIVISILVSLWLLCTGLAAFSQILGDVNGNGTVDINDALIVARYTAGFNPIPFYSNAADADASGSVNIVDAMTIARYSSGLITTLPPGGTVTPTPTVTQTPTPTSSGGQTQIVLNNNVITVNGGGVTVNGSTATVTAAGTYSISGTLNNGQIAVDTDDDGTVTIVLNGATITNSTTAPINIISADTVELVLADNTRNTVTDPANYVFPDAETDEPNAAIFSKDDIIISGHGSLIVNGNYNDGIGCKNGVTITGGTISVNAIDDGIRGKDFLVVNGGNLTIIAGGDGLKSDEDSDSTQGYITIETGVFDITAGGDAIAAENTVSIMNGQFTLTAGGGSNYTVSDDESAKGINGNASVTISGGTFNINSADDGINAQTNAIIKGGTLTIASGDDAIHGDTSLEISGGDINITNSYEGLESLVIDISNGTIHVVSSDDCISVADPNATDGGFSVSPNCFLYIRGGYIAVNVSGQGDGIDSNGHIEMSNGTLISSGPPSGPNVAIDYNGTFTISGGFVVGAGYAMMAQAPGSTNSPQNSLLINPTITRQAGTLVHIRDSSGKGILTYAPTKSYQTIGFSSPELVRGSTYTVYFGGSSTGTVKDGLYQGGTYSGGTQYATFTVSGAVTTIR